MPFKGISFFEIATCKKTERAAGAIVSDCPCGSVATGRHSVVRGPEYKRHDVVNVVKLYEAEKYYVNINYKKLS